MEDALSNRLAAILANAAMCPQHVASIANVPQQTVTQWMDGTKSPDNSTNKLLEELELLVDRLSRIYKPNEARAWLFTSQSLLGCTNHQRIFESSKSMARD